MSAPKKKPARPAVPNSAKQDARAYMETHPGTTYQQALKYVRAAAKAPVTWVDAIGGVPTAEDLTARWGSRSRDLRVPVGTSSEGTVWIDLSYTAHWAVAGLPGTGKTTLHREIALSLATLYGPDRVQMLFLDSIGTAWTLGDLPHTLETIRAHDGIDGAREAMRKIHSLFQARMELGQLAASKDKGPLNRWPLNLPDVVIFIEDATALWMTEESRKVLNDIALHGRSLGIHLILASQTYDHRTVEPVMSVITGTGGTVAFRCAKASLSRALLDSSAAVTTDLARGEAFIRHDGELTRFTTYDVTPQNTAEVHGVLASMKTPVSSLQEAEAAVHEQIQQLRTRGDGSPVK